MFTGSKVQWDMPAWLFGEVRCLTVHILQNHSARGRAPLQGDAGSLHITHTCSSSSSSTNSLKLNQSDMNTQGSPTVERKCIRREETLRRAAGEGSDFHDGVLRSCGQLASGHLQVFLSSPSSHSCFLFSLKPPAFPVHCLFSSTVWSDPTLVASALSQLGVRGKGASLGGVQAWG